MTERLKIHFGAFSLFAYGALAAIPAALAAVIEKSLAYAGSLKEQAQQIGVSVKALQEYRYAASQTGIEQEQLDRGLQFLNRNLGLVETGAKKPTKALHDLGFGIQEINKIAQNGAENALPQIADKLEKINDPARRARIEVALFGRAGQTLDPLLRQGSAGIDGLRQAAERLGIVLGPAQIEQAHQAEIRFKAVKEVLEANIAGAVANNANAIIGLANSLLKLIGVLAQIPHYWDQAMARIAKADIIAEQGVLKADDMTRKAGLGSLLGDTRPWFEQSLKEDQARVARIPATVPGASAPRPLRLGADEDLSLDSLKDYTPAIANALKAKKGQTKKDPIDRYVEEIQRITEEESSLHERINTALADVAGTEEARAKAEKLNADERATREHAQTDAEIHRIQTSKDYTAAEKDALVKKLHANQALATQASELEKQTITLKEQDRLQKEGFELKIAENQNQQDILKAQESLTSDRRIRVKLEKALVNLAIDQEELAQQEIIDSRTASKAQKDIAQARINTLQTLRGLEIANVDQQNLSPWQSYIKSLRDGLANVNDTLEQLAVDNVKKLEDTLAGATSKALKLHGALGDIVTALIRIGIQQAELAAFGGGSGGGGGFLGGLLRIFGGGGGGTGAFVAANNGLDFSSVLSGISGTPHFAGGGRPPTGQPSVVGENGPELWWPDSAGTIIPNGKMSSAARVTVYVVANDYFDAHVHGITGPVIAQAATRAARGGAALARQELQTQQLHYLG